MNRSAGRHRVRRIERSYRLSARSQSVITAGRNCLSMLRRLGHRLPQLELVNSPRIPFKEQRPVNRPHHQGPARFRSHSGGMPIIGKMLQPVRWFRRARTLLRGIDRLDIKFANYKAQPNLQDNLEISAEVQAPQERAMYLFAVRRHQKALPCGVECRTAHGIRILGRAGSRPSFVPGISKLVQQIAVHGEALGS
jgi:hypothetical protein